MTIYIATCETKMEPWAVETVVLGAFSSSENAAKHCDYLATKKGDWKVTTNYVWYRMGYFEGNENNARYTFRIHSYEVDDGVML